MGRYFVLLGVLLVLLVESPAVWAAQRSPADPFLVSGATAVQVTGLGAHAWQIRYRAPGEPGTWYTELVQQLERDHWSSPDPVGYASGNRSYMRASSLGIGEVWDWVMVWVDPFHPEVAQIRWRREVVFPWWQHLSQLVRSALQSLNTALRSAGFILLAPADRHDGDSRSAGAAQWSFHHHRL
jgi:hypothetical protein